MLNQFTIHDFVGISWYVIMNGQIFILLGFLAFLHLERAPYNDAWLYKQKKSFFVQFMYLDEKPLSIVKSGKSLSRKSSLAIRTWAKQE